MKTSKKTTKKAYKPKRSYKKRMTKSTTAPKTTKGLKKFVMGIVNDGREDKQAFHTLGSGQEMVPFESGMYEYNLHRIIPNIQKGVEENERIGEQINAKSLVLKGIMKFNYETQEGSPNMSNVAVRVMCLSLKTSPSWQQSLSNMTNSLENLLRRGATTVPFKGYLEDIYSPVNTDLFTVHYNKVFYINQSYFVQIGTGGGPVSADLKNTVKFFTIKLKVKNKLLKYSNAFGANDDLLPSNYSPFFIAGYSYLNGASPDGQEAAQLKITYNTELKYEDS